MDLTGGETIIYQAHPSWRSILAFYIKGTFAALVLGAIAGAVTKVADDAVDKGLVVLVVLLAVVIVVAIGWLRRMSTEYTITNRRLHIRRGLLSRATEETRVERIQNANTTQSFLERILKVGTVDFDVASTERVDLFRFAGVEDPHGVVRAVDRAQEAATKPQPIVTTVETGPLPGEPPAPPVS